MGFFEELFRYGMKETFRQGNQAMEIATSTLREGTSIKPTRSATVSLASGCVRFPAGAIGAIAVVIYRSTAETATGQVRT